jgi:hypothetical protein
MRPREHAAFTADPHVITLILWLGQDHNTMSLAAMGGREDIVFTADPHVINSIWWLGRDHKATYSCVASTMYSRIRPPY